MKSRHFKLTLFLIFLVLSPIHFYWAFFGDWGLLQAIPTDINGNRLLNPSSIDSAIVGIILLSFGLYYLIKRYKPSKVTKWIDLPMGWLIPILFFLRAIGDFKYVGFFKEIGSTPFARADYMFFSPLCLLISVLGFFIVMQKHSSINTNSV